MSKIDHMTAFNMALDLVKEAGFVLSHVSKITETCYYYHPSTPERLLRVATHKSKRGPIGLGGVAARLTFSQKDGHHTQSNVWNRTALTIGMYFLSQPQPSKYGVFNNGQKADLNRRRAREVRPVQTPD